MGDVKLGALVLLERWIEPFRADPALTARTEGWKRSLRFTVDGEELRLDIGDGLIDVGPWPRGHEPDLELACDRSTLDDLADGRLHFFLALWGSGRISFRGSWGDAYRLGYILSADHRGRRVVFVAHCWLNVNTRFPGGGSHPGANPSVLSLLVDSGAGIIQMPCPEQKVFGLEKHRFGTLDPDEVRTRFETVAAGVVDDIQEYRGLGHDVVAIVGMDPSPSCGVRVTRGKPVLLGAGSRIEEVPGTQGVFMEALRRMAGERGIPLPPLVGVRRVLSPSEGDPEGLPDLRRRLEPVSNGVRGRENIE